MQFKELKKGLYSVERTEQVKQKAVNLFYNELLTDTGIRKV